MADTVYGVALNDRQDFNRLGQVFSGPPYGGAPATAVLYIKPKACVQANDGTVYLPRDLAEVGLAPTWALLFGDAPNVVSGVALALEILEPHESFYRPAVRQRCRDGFLPLGAFRPWDRIRSLPEFELLIDGQPKRSWRPQDLLRDPETLIAVIGAFMTLSDGDVLLVGGTMEKLHAGTSHDVKIRAPGFAHLDVRLKREAVQ